MDAAIADVLNELEHISCLKEEQTVALKAFLQKKDVFALLPTGFGKSLIFQLAPLVGKKLAASENPMIVVISPLVALMQEQVREARSLRLIAYRLGEDNDADIKKGLGQIIFGSPEQWLLNKKYRAMLSSAVFGNVRS